MLTNHNNLLFDIDNTQYWISHTGLIVGIMCLWYSYMVALLTFKIFLSVVSAHPVSAGGSRVTDDVCEALHRQCFLPVLLLLFFLQFLHRSFLIFLIHLNLQKDGENEKTFTLGKKAQEEAVDTERTLWHKELQDSSSCQRNRVRNRVTELIHAKLEFLLRGCMPLWTTQVSLTVSIHTWMLHKHFLPDSTEDLHMICVTKLVSDQISPHLLLRYDID